MLRVFCDNPISTFRPMSGSTAEPSTAAIPTARERFYATGSTSSTPEEAHSARTCLFSAPKQVVVPRNTSLAEMCTMLSAAGVQFPVISKPIASDGTDGSHSLTLFLSSKALQVRTPQHCLRA